MTKYSLSSSTAELSQQTEDNLYELGLLTRPRDRIRITGTGTHPTRPEQRKTLLYPVSSSTTLVPETCFNVKEP